MSFNNHTVTSGGAKHPATFGWIAAELKGYFGSPVLVGEGRNWGSKRPTVQMVCERARFWLGLWKKPVWRTPETRVATVDATTAKGLQTD